MMSLHLRVVMLIAAVLFTAIVVYHVNHKKVRLEYLLVWLIISVALLIAAIFPGVVTWLCRITGIETPSNLVYLFGIFILLLISFRQTIVISQQADAIKQLTQAISLEKHQREQEDTHEAP